MALFTKGALTKKGQALLAKSETNGTGISLTKACTGSGVYSDTSTEALEQLEELISPQQTFAFSSMDTVEGNESVAVLDVVIHNRGLTNLYYLNELGVYAEDPDEGEILYLILVSEQNDTFYIPADNETGGFSAVTVHIYVEVANVGQTTINTTGAVASASDFKALQQVVEAVTANLKGGTAGQMLLKESSENYAYGWKDTNIVTRSYDDFPATGRSDALYIDSDSSEFYIWQTLSDGTDGYFKLPVGSEASETLQEQITANAKNISDMQEKFNTVTLTVPTAGWTSGTEDGISVYTQSLTVADVTADTDGTVYPCAQSTGASDMVAELKAAGVFFGNGIAESGAGALALTCYKKKPQADFGIKFQWH